MREVYLPPSVIGIIGGGQLGMMTIREAQRMGYRSVVWDPDPECPASRLADRTITAPFDDRSACAEFAREADFITYEFEHIDTGIVRMLEESKRVRPGSAILDIAQHRTREKEALRSNGFPIAPFEVVRRPEDLVAAAGRLGYPMVLKTAGAGYDGKGQTVLGSRSALESVRFLPGEPERIVEKFLKLNAEISVICIRDDQGNDFDFPIARNTHRDNILHSSIVPSGMSEAIERKARKLANTILDTFHVVGILCVEMFVVGTRVLVNELAPRPHNSGHYTLDGCDLSQFEAHVRVAAGLPMRPPALLGPCAIVNLLGKHLRRLDVQAIQKIPGTKLHIYGKKRLEERRKMGHISVVGRTKVDVAKVVREIERMIGEGGVGEDDGRTKRK